MVLGLVVGSADWWLVLRYFSVCFGVDFVWVLRALVLWYLVVVGLLLVGFLFVFCAFDLLEFDAVVLVVLSLTCTGVFLGFCVVFG